MDTNAARRYVWKALAITLEQDIKSGAYLNEELATEFDRRRIKRAAEQVLRTMQRKAEEPTIGYRHGLTLPDGPPTAEGIEDGPPVTMADALAAGKAMLRAGRRK